MPVLSGALGRLGGLPWVVDAGDAVTWWLAVVRGGVEAHLVPVGVVQFGQDPADRREVHPGVRLAERGEPGREVLNGFLRRDPDVGRYRIMYVVEGELITVDRVDRVSN